MARTPVNIVTGFLGVGKTTAILHLLKSKPKNEKWAVIVNEYGEVSIDGPIIAEFGEGIKVKEISGGCMCCIGKILFDAALAEIAIRMKPDRILVEPSGLGHIRDLIHTIRSKSFAPYVVAKAPICLIDPRYLDDPMIYQSIVFESQVEYSPIILSNKSDIVSQSNIDNFNQWSKSLVPAKIYLSTIRMGEIPVELLDEELSDLAEKTIQITGMFHPSQKNNNENILPTPSVPVIKINSDTAFCAVGLILHVNDVLDYSRLIQFIVDLSCIRMKGMVHTNEGWFIIQKASTEISTDKSLPHADSRLEFIFTSESQNILNLIPEQILNIVL